MCGIAATIDIDDSTLFTRLFSALRHRGPDESNSVCSGRVRLGCHRLAIVDPDGGRQPITSSDGRRVLVFNGEIYNHRSLRDEFCGYDFRTQTDGEVIFPLVERDGPGGLIRLRGMFAFVLVDLATGDFLAARDPFGIKPLYVLDTHGGLAFASEMKSFAGLPGRLRFVPPGHYVTPSGLGRYYRVPARRWRRRRAPLSQLLEDAVRWHVPSEGPCGVLLSGGLDSSVVAVMAARVRPDITAYTIVLPGAPDEVPASEIAAHLGIRHVVVRATAGEALAALAPAIAHLESFHPVMVRNALPLYLIARRAAHDTKVLLGGDGADELFAGYSYLASLPRRFWPLTIEAGINNLHRTELQRADRMTMAHGVELRVPFLDVPLAEAAIDLPLSEKVRVVNGRRVTKWALRAAVTDLLPWAICWREKTTFGDGSGFSALASGAPSAAGVGEARGAGWALPDSETTAYFRLWRARLPDVRAEVPIWADAGRYGGFDEEYGHPLLGLFRR